MFFTRHDEFFLFPQLEKIPFLIHGFGTNKWKESDFKKKSLWRDFKLVFLNQIHSNIIHFIDEVPEKSLRGDAVLTHLHSVLLIIKTADCLPVLIVDESQKVIAAVHCGWKGTCKKVIQKAIHGMRDHYGCHPSSLLVAMGPCIGSGCYEVGEDVRKCFKKDDHSTDYFQSHSFREGKYLFDLRRANFFQLVNLGVEEKKIFFIDICTHCHKELPSYRRDKNRAGRMLSFIGMSF